MPKIEAETTIHNAARFRIVRQTISLELKTEEREIVEIGSGVSIVLLDSHKNVALIREWRSAFNKYIYQIPGGFCGSNNENALKKAAKQELREEFGLEKKGIELKKMKIFYPLGSIRNTLHIYLAMVDEFGNIKPQNESFEDIKVTPMPLNLAYQKLVLGNKLTTAATIIGLTLAKNLIDKTV